MGNYADGISPFVRDAVNKMNKVGIDRMWRYCNLKYPRRDFGKGLKLIRAIALFGYSNAAKQFKVSKQHAMQTLEKYYALALEVENEIQTSQSL